MLHSLQSDEVLLYTTEGKICLPWMDITQTKCSKKERPHSCPAGFYGGYVDCLLTNTRLAHVSADPARFKGPGETTPDRARDGRRWEREQRVAVRCGGIRPDEWG